MPGSRQKNVTASLKFYPEASIMLIQLEIPLEAVRFAAAQANARGMTVILNPAPANNSIPELYNLIDIITPNLHEAEMLTGMNITDPDSAVLAAKELQKLGVPVVIITLGTFIEIL